MDRWLRSPKPFADRAQAGRELGERLASTIPAQTDVVVLALPRGGAPVGFEVARTLHAPLDVMIVRKLGAPFQPEFALGAVASGGVTVLNQDALYLEDEATIEQLAAAQRIEIKRREALYRSQRPAVQIANRTVVLVDDGAATGASMRAAIQAVRRLGASRIIVALPVAASEACSALREIADEVACLMTPAYFTSVGQWYADFEQTSDAEVQQLLERAAEKAS